MNLMLQKACLEGFSQSVEVTNLCVFTSLVNYYKFQLTIQKSGMISSLLQSLVYNAQVVGRDDTP